MKLVINNLKQYVRSSKAVFLFNIVGFTVAFTAFLVIAIQVSYDFSYNKNFEKSDEIYRFSRYHHANGNTYWSINQSLAKEIQEKIPEIKSYCLLQQNQTAEISVETNGIKREHASPLIEATPGFFDVFTPEILSGSIEKIFDGRGKALISEETARQLFGETNPLGQMMHVRDSILTVTAVYKDFPENCSLLNGIYTYMPPNTPNNWNYDGYFLIDPSNVNSVTDKMNSVDVVGEEVFRLYSEHPENKVELQLQAQKDLYLHGDNKRINMTLSLSAIGIILLLVAFINYINFAVSMAPARIKNVNIHKIFGISPVRLRMAIAAEAALFTVIALALSLICLYFLKSSALAANFVADLSITGNRQIIAVTLPAVFFVSVLIGIYPAVYITSFNEAFAVKGSFSLSPKGVILRNFLIFFQFTASIALICISGMIKLQNDYMQNYSWGFEKENIAYMNLANTAIDAELFGNELKQNASATDYTLSWNLPGKVGMSWSRNFEGKPIDFFTVWPVTANFLDFFGVKIASGNNFPQEADREKIIFNQEFMKKNDLTEDIIGKEFEGFSPADIVGVVENINFESLHEPIKPMAFVVFPNKQNYNFLYVKLSGNNLPANIAQIEQTWKKFTDKPFDLRFLDDSMNELYKNEVNTGNLISAFGLISVLIAMMGVYGLVLFNTRYKTKEIAIRKINGATEKEILQLLNRNMLRLLLVSFPVAIPIILLVINNWMERFAYKAPVPWWLLPGSGLLVLLISGVTVSWQSYKAAIANPVDSLKTE
ncbi:MAG: ABC transporter permease [Proteiniphilum sp.]|jgi:putative ABC transport system permease protein|nr:ABC transporter permease [Proteiniphilum sp.]